MLAAELDLCVSNMSADGNHQSEIATLLTVPICHYDLYGATVTEVKPEAVAPHAQVCVCACVCVRVRERKKGHALHYVWLSVSACLSVSLSLSLFVVHGALLPGYRARITHLSLSFSLSPSLCVCVCVCVCVLAQEEGHAASAYFGPTHSDFLNSVTIQYDKTDTDPEGASEAISPWECFGLQDLSARTPRQDFESLVLTFTLPMQMQVGCWLENSSQD
eukprot:COSAG05_NODE_1476_length_4780_cov_9.024989_6_plen_219_part_00